MTEEELREMFAALEAQGLRPMLCDTPVAVYDGRVPCGTPTLSYGEIVSMAKLPQGLLSINLEFFVSVQGDSMEDAGIEAGDLVYIVCGVQVYDGDVVLASIDDEYTLKVYYEDRDGKRWLLPQNDKYEPILLDGQFNVNIVGRAKGVLKPDPRVASRVCDQIVQRAMREAELRVPTEQEVAEAIREAAPLVTAGRQWFAVYRALADLCVVGEDSFDAFISRVMAAVPEHECPPTARELQRMEVGCFTKPMILWSEDKAPVKGKRYKDYVAIAQRVKDHLHNKN